MYVLSCGLKYNLATYQSDNHQSVMTTLSYNNIWVEYMIRQ